MNQTIQTNWSQANQNYLLTSIKLVQKELKIFYHSRLNNGDGKVNLNKNDTDWKLLEEALSNAHAQLPSESNLERLVAVFGLSEFEKKILLMAVAVELEASFASLLTSINGDSNNVYPNFGLALAAFSDAHWSATSPQSPLRYWRLLELNNRSLITKSNLKLDEAILHYLTGVQYLDERLNDIFELIIHNTPLVDSQIKIADEILTSTSKNTLNNNVPIIQLSGINKGDKKNLAAFVVEQMGLRLYRISSNSIQTNTRDNAEMIRLWNREAALKSFALYLETDDVNQSEKNKLQAIQHFLERMQGVVILSTDEWSPMLNRRKIHSCINKPLREEQKQLWEENLGNYTKNLKRGLFPLITQFNMSAYTIHNISNNLSIKLQSTEEEDKSKIDMDDLLWKACCEDTRPKIDELIKRIEPFSTWENIVLPSNQKQVLEDLAIQVKQRNKVYEEWGFSKMGSRGLGISALFYGESGTGKTMASEVLANELKLDLYKIDLSQVVNKYIGETEKNLKRIFDAAEEGGAILLFDEADALFGKRSDVKDSHDRYSNIEVSYLLQRMEAYRGLAILTTNMKSAIDKAFLRRIRFVVQFSFPDQIHRREIWKRAFPAETPVQSLDMEKLSRLNVSGGNIRNIALNAAFVAADRNESVQMQHILKAAKSEYVKLEKTLSTYEVKGW